MEDEDEVLRVDDAITSTGMEVLMCDINSTPSRWRLNQGMAKSTSGRAGRSAQRA